MATAAARRLGPRVRAGLVVASTPASVPDGFELIVGGHPIPTVESERAGRRALELAGSLQADERLLVLVSGGASALMAVPADGITLEDKRATTDCLLRAGADIHALNTVRKHLSSIKGGWLAARAGGSCDALVISDVVGDDPSFIASGPTVADASRFEDALDVLRRFGGEGAYPPAVVARLRNGGTAAVPETPKPGDARLAQTRTTVIGSRRDAMAGAAAEAAALGYPSRDSTTPWSARRGRRRWRTQSDAGARRRPRPSHLHRLERRNHRPRHRAGLRRPQSSSRRRRRPAR
jgi:hydroxypyruvate reductase